MVNKESQQHSMKRRCFVHNYKGRSIYLITLEVAERKPLLGRVVTSLRPSRLMSASSATVEAEVPLSVSGLSDAELKAVNTPLFEPSVLGRRVAEEFMKIGEHVPGVKPLLAQAMPDHFHGILFITREINRSLGSIMAGFKGKCSQISLALTRGAPNPQGLTPRAPNPLALTRGAPNSQGLTPRAPNPRGVLGGARVSGSLWESGYHDRILTSEGQLEKMVRYVIDNPRRAALRLLHRELFTGVRRLSVAGRSFEAYGNGFLLQRPEITQVQCSRRFFGFKRVEKQGLTPDAANAYRVVHKTSFETPDFAKKREALFAAAKNGAVLCSPCISDGEKAIAYAAVDAGYPLIVLRNEPFPPRFKPNGWFFDACAEGRLLILYPLGLTPRSPNKTISRAECLALNAIVADICGATNSRYWEMCLHSRGE